MKMDNLIFLFEKAVVKNLPSRCVTLPWRECAIVCTRSGHKRGGSNLFAQHLHSSSLWQSTIVKTCGMHFRWLWGFCLDFVFCASASCALLKFCVLGKSVPCIDSAVFLYLCILAFVLWFLYFRSSARISVMCQCAHLDTVLPPSSSMFPLSIQIVHNNIIPLEYVQMNQNYSNITCSCQFHVFSS